ncbi:hypothetical protein GGF44_004113, partial [Coemansia sp. RSA 1694]
MQLDSFAKQLLLLPLSSPALELYDDEADAAYDELQDVSEEDQGNFVTVARLAKGVDDVKCALGPDTGIEDREIKESLWYYFFDTEATIAWLQ